MYSKIEVGDLVEAVDYKPRFVESTIDYKWHYPLVGCMGIVIKKKLYAVDIINKKLRITVKFFNGFYGTLSGGQAARMLKLIS